MIKKINALTARQQLGDRHPLEIQVYQGIRILTPRAFLTIIGEQPPSSR